VTPVSPPVDAGLVLRLISGLGSPDFLKDVGDECMRRFGADQVTAFIVEGPGVRCVLAHRPRAMVLARDLCSRYMSRFFPRDAVLAGRDAGSPGFEVRTVTGAEIADVRYRDSLFTHAGLGGKLSVTSVQDRRMIYLNLYFRDAAPARLLDVEERLAPVGQVLAHAIGRHDALTGGLLAGDAGKLRMEALLRTRFPILSRREAEVCARIVSGLSLEGIALDLHVSPTTAATFRRRAYAKLEVSSQNELFAHCAGLMAA